MDVPDSEKVLVADSPIAPRNAFLRFLHREANFFRIHLFVFTITPLIFSGIFYGANGECRMSSCLSYHCVLNLTLGNAKFR